MGAPLDVLFVEDDESDAELAVRALVSAGYEPTWSRVDNAIALEDALSRKSWDIIISDYHMPSFTAVDALGIVQRHGIDVPFLLVSGTVGEDRAVAMVKAGAHDYMLKHNLSRLGVAVGREIRDAAGRRMHRQAEAALRASEERYRVLFERNLAGVYRCALDGRILECNDSFARTYGYSSRDDLLGSTAKDLYPGLGGWQVFLDQLRADGALASYESERRRKDGSAVWVLENATLVDAGAEPAFVEGTVIDVTERRHLEEQLRQAQKMEVVGQLAGGIAHDFNNLLSVINGYAELALRGLPPGGALRKKLEEISRAGERAAALTHQLLAFSRKQLVQPHVLDLNEVVTGIQELLRRLIREDIQLATELSPEPQPVTADRGQMEQILLNLVVNARDAMPEGGRIVIETALLAEDHPRDPGEPAGIHVLLSVTDTGIGIDDKIRSHLFEPFFTTKEGTGTGLGLATVHEIVTRWGGLVTVRSAPGHGATFRVLLPRAPGSGAPPLATAGADVSRGGHETILLVEDEDSVRGLSLQILQGLGYYVLEARNGPEALAMSERHDRPIDLLLSDVVMPGMSGRELRERLMGSRPRIKVLYVSGYAEDAVLQSGLHEGDAGLLYKPFTVESLGQKVRAILDGPSKEK